MKITKSQLIIFSIAAFSMLVSSNTALASASESAGQITQTASPWIKGISAVLIAAAGVAFIFAIIGAIQREWQKVFTSLLVFVIAGFAPIGINYLAKQYGVESEVKQAGFGG
jgi:hypothetical protein